MQRINLTIDFNQLILMIKQCDIEQKLVIFKELEKETYKVRFKSLLKELKNNSLTEKEITKEVEMVREKRYKAKKS